MLGASAFVSASATANWSKSYGDAGVDEASAVQATLDGGYIVAGETSSFEKGNSDAWLLRVNGDGDILWQKAYGGPGFDSARAIYATPDGGYVVGGDTISFTPDGHTHPWVLKLRGDGIVDWQKIYVAKRRSRCIRYSMVDILRTDRREEYA